ncbi:adenylate/guanylate cyclase domain-containing protein [Methylobacterium sp. J-078]|uniref:adenylate/guanylate cyclase domain-containing protein n=1 Tax=Methylobacterium sp. J-078 TaxID=2836657 RepID=UPI001FB8C572|nr:adenylate/guanylate cyclase domain-containing protein [Methylobacterium sp. J-078]MCJ2044499.1 adenylate/guanylate cyclase domain-containing protein [Methylobacterium sp. J-078]
MRIPSRRRPNAGDSTVLNRLQLASGRRSLVLHLVIVLVLLATAQGYDGSNHSIHHWVGLGVYAVVSLGLALADWRAAHRDGRTERTNAWLTWSATLLNAGVALFLVVEHILVGAVETEETATAVSRLPAFLLLLQTGLSMRVWHTVVFSGLVSLAWGGTILLAFLEPDHALLGPYVTLEEEVTGLLTFAAASLVVIDGVRRLRSAVSTALRMERERASLARFVPSRVAGELAETGGGLGGVQSRHACLFGLDLRGFSAFSREHSQEEVVRALLDVRALTHVAVTEHGGIVDKYVGDGILAQFIVGRPQAQAEAALTCTRTIATRLERLNAERRGEGRPLLRITMALHAGEVLVGVFDDGHRAEFTVLGTAMNRLARIEARAKAANLTLAGSCDLVRLLSPAVRARLHLADMPPSDCADTRDMQLFAVSWREGAEATQDEAVTPAA